jgi:hypothetical protein
MLHAAESVAADWSVPMFVPATAPFRTAELEGTKRCETIAYRILIGKYGGEELYEDLHLDVVIS